MRTLWLTRHWVAALVLALSLCIPPAARAEVSWPLEGFAAVNGTRLQYLDWGGPGPALILIHGLGDDPHVFDDMAPAFADSFHVIAYARRGSGSSDAEGPYDTGTLTEDLRGLMDALGIAKADLVGVSAGGNEITEMAGRYPERVGRIVYLDAVYDGADAEFRAVVNARPAFERPTSAMASLDAFRNYEREMRYPGLDDMRRIEGYLRKKIVIQPDGSVKDRAPAQIRNALYAALWSDRPRDYTRVRCPALVIYADHYYPPIIADERKRREVVDFEARYWIPFQLKSIERVRRELANVEVVRVPGAHSSFYLTNRQRVIDTMLRFLKVPSQSSAKVVP